MFKRSYLTKAFHFYCLLALVLMLYFSFFRLFALLLPLYIFLNFVYRRNPQEGSKPLLNSQDVALAPVNGKIISIEKNCFIEEFNQSFTHIKITAPWFIEGGITMPVNAEVKEFVVRKKGKIHRIGIFSSETLKDSNIGHLGVCLEDKLKNFLILEFAKKQWGPWPKLWIMPGDKGKLGVNIGHSVFGGGVSLYLPQNYEILTGQGVNIRASETVMAGLAGEKL